MYISVRPYRIVVALVLAFAILAVSAPASAANTSYYVDSASGSDSNSGASEATPWKSLSKVNSTSFGPGDTINFKRGGSWQGTLTVNASGSAGAPITFQAYGDGPNPVIGQTRSGNSRTVVLKGSHIVIKNFVLHDAQEAGVEVVGNQNTIQDNEMYADGWGVRFWGDNNRVIGNYIHDLSMVVSDSASDNDYGAAGVVIWGGADGQEIAYNRFTRCKARSVDYGTDGGVVEFWENSQGHNIHHNYTSGNNSAFEVGGGVVSNVTIHHNVFNDDSGGHTGFHWGGKFSAAVVNWREENNTIISSGGVFAFWNGTPSDASRVVVRNNIILARGSVYNSSLFTHANNLYFFPGGGKLGSAPLGPGEKVADPLFADQGNGDFHLRAGSPAIDAGMNLGHALDFDGNSIPLAAAPDMGAFEYGTSTAQAAPAPSSQPRFVLGFRELSLRLEALAGDPVEDEWHNPENGDGLQRTTTGMMVWRKADNWTAFTDGTSSWVNGPYGVQKRTNDERFEWEQGQ